MIGINGEKLHRVVCHWKTRRQPHDPYFDSVLGLCASALPKQDFAPFVSSTGSKSINCTSSDVGGDYPESFKRCFCSARVGGEGGNQQLFIIIIIVNTFSAVSVLVTSPHFTAQNHECRLRDSLSQDVFFFLIRRVQIHVHVSIQTNKIGSPTNKRLYLEESVVPKWRKLL